MLWEIIIAIASLGVVLGILDLTKDKHGTEQSKTN